MSGPVEIVLIVVVVAYVLVRRFLGEPAEAKRMLLLPVIVTGIALTKLGGIGHSAAAIGFVVATAVVSVLVGLFRGATIKVFRRDGIVFLRYTAITLVVWVASFAVRFGMGFAFKAIDPAAAAAAGSTTMLSLGLGLLAEGVIVLVKGMRTGDTVIWSKGRQGGPHQKSQWLDDLQQRLTERDRTRR